MFEPNPQNELNLELFADYFQIYIQDEKVTGDLSTAWTDDATENLLAIANGTIGIGTARNMTVPVAIKNFNADPGILPDPEQSVNRINECELEVSSGTIVIAGCTDYFPDAARFKLANGTYKIRIYYRNLDKLSEDGLDGEDSYEVHLWLS